MMGFKVTEAAGDREGAMSFRKQWWDLKNSIKSWLKKVSAGFRKQWWDLKNLKEKRKEYRKIVLENNDGI